MADLLVPRRWSVRFEFVSPVMVDGFAIRQWSVTTTARTWQGAVLQSCGQVPAALAEAVLASVAASRYWTETRD